MRIQTVITITSVELEEKEAKQVEELLNSPALLDRAGGNLKEIIKETLGSGKNGETVEIEFRKVEG